MSLSLAESYPLREERRGRDGYLCFLGRANPEKGPEVAIRAAKRLGRHLAMMVKMNEPEEQAYWRDQCEPLLPGADVEVDPNVTPERKVELLASADAMLFPIQWDEPFGLVIVESMACGTPVTAYRRGAAPEVVVDGQTGFLVEPDDADALVAAVDRVGEIAPTRCRHHVERHLSSRAMVGGYARIYQRLASAGRRGPADGPGLRPSPGTEVPS